MLVNHGPSQQSCEERIPAMEMKYFRKMLHILYKDHVTNEKVCAKIQQATGPHEDLLTIVKRRKLSGMDMSPVHQVCQNHLARNSEREENTRQTQRWEDNIKEWTGLELAKSQRAVEYREKWRKLIAKSSVVPQRPSRLRVR